MTTPAHPGGDTDAGSPSTGRFCAEPDAPTGTRVTLLAGADHDTGTVVGKREIDAKSNEIPELRTQIAGMDLTGALATADGAHCQNTTAEQIVAAGGHYLLTLKANQSNLAAIVGLAGGRRISVDAIAVMSG